jgi:hypothetical protein
MPGPHVTEHAVLAGMPSVRQKYIGAVGPAADGRGTAVYWAVGPNIKVVGDELGADGAVGDGAMGDGVVGTRDESRGSDVGCSELYAA